MDARIDRLRYFGLIKENDIPNDQIRPKEGRIRIKVIPGTALDELDRYIIEIVTNQPGVGIPEVIGQLPLIVPENTVRNRIRSLTRNNYIESEKVLNRYYRLYPVSNIETREQKPELTLTKEEYGALDPLHQAIADVAAKKGLVEIVDDLGGIQNSS